MYAIISELDVASAETVRCLWRKLRVACGLKAIFNLPTPHLTWLVAEDLDTSLSSLRVDCLTANNCGFRTQSFGLGIFSGARPVLYLPLVKTQAMIDIHNQVWDQIPAFSNQLNQYYDPQNWIPHISLAVSDLSSENLVCAMDSLAFEPIEIAVTVDNMMIVAQDADPSNETLYRFRFCG